jgi:hypothetical protein
MMDYKRRRNLQVAICRMRVIKAIAVGWKAEEGRKRKAG